MITRKENPASSSSNPSWVQRARDWAKDQMEEKYQKAIDTAQTEGFVQLPIPRIPFTGLQDVPNATPPKNRKWMISTPIANTNMNIVPMGAAGAWNDSKQVAFQADGTVSIPRLFVNDRIYLKGGVSEHNPGNWQTHFAWDGDNRNYVRGDTELRGNTNNIGDFTVGRIFCLGKTCLKEADLKTILAWKAPFVPSVPPTNSFTFTPCGATGREGPTLDQCIAAYRNAAPWITDRNAFTMGIRGIQIWTVPITGSYQFTVAGAAGGPVYNIPGNGVVANYNNVPLNAGDRLYIVVGQRAPHIGGGGATWVFKNSVSQGSLMFVSGGGGGPGLNAYYSPGPASPFPNGGNGQLTSRGQDGYDSLAGKGGQGSASGGGGGGTGQVAGNPGGPGTGGDQYGTDNTNGNGGGGGGGVSGVNASTTFLGGLNPKFPVSGGFGGGGAGAANGWGAGGGGGGGYGGGGGGAGGNSRNRGGSGGGGGGSWYVGHFGSWEASNRGEGYVTVRFPQAVSAPPPPAAPAPTPVPTPAPAPPTAKTPAPSQFEYEKDQTFWSNPEWDSVTTDPKGRKRPPKRTITSAFTVYYKGQRITQQLKDGAPNAMSRVTTYDQIPGAIRFERGTLMETRNYPGQGKVDYYSVKRIVTM